MTRDGLYSAVTKEGNTKLKFPSQKAYFMMSFQRESQSNGAPIGAQNVR